MTTAPEPPVPNLVQLIHASPMDREWYPKIAKTNVPRPLLAAAKRACTPDSSSAAWAAEAFRALPASAKPGFVDVFDFELFTERFLELIETDGLAPDQQAFATALAWMNPARTCRFEMELVDAASGLLPRLRLPDVSFGGPDDLHIAERSDPDVVSVLKGSVQAATDLGALHRAQEVLDTFLGAFRTAGMCVFWGWRPEIPKIRIDDGWRTSFAEEYMLSPEYARRAFGTRFIVPGDLSGIEQREAAERGGAASSPSARHLRYVRKILAGTSQHAAAVRNCCRLAVVAENTREFGLAIVVGFGCLEGLLLSDSGKEDVVAKLSEAVVHSIARDFDEERALRRRVKHLYGIRISVRSHRRGARRGRSPPRTVESPVSGLETEGWTTSGRQSCRRRGGDIAVAGTRGAHRASEQTAHRGGLDLGRVRVITQPFASRGPRAGAPASRTGWPASQDVVHESRPLVARQARCPRSGSVCGLRPRAPAAYVR